MRVHVGVNFPVDELQEQREVLRVTLVQCRRREKDVVGAVA